MKTVKLVINTDEVSEEIKQSVEETLNTFIENLSEPQRIKYLKDVHATFSKDAAYKRTH